MSLPALYTKHEGVMAISSRHAVHHHDVRQTPNHIQVFQHCSSNVVLVEKWKLDLRTGESPLSTLSGTPLSALPGTTSPKPSSCDMQAVSALLRFLHQVLQGEIPTALLMKASLSVVDSSPGPIL